MDPELIIAVAAAALSLVSGVYSARVGLRADRQRRQETAAEEHERILHLYREPLVDAANSLQSRLYNIMMRGEGRGFLDRFYLNPQNTDDRDYARDHTVYAIAEYLCWVEILRRELRFLGLGDQKTNRELMKRLEDIQHAFQRADVPHQFEIFRGRQRAIAELMRVPTNASEGPRSECMGYAAFTDRLADDPGFEKWFAALRADVDVVAHATVADSVRLVHLQRELIDLIDFLDPHHIQVPDQVRGRLPEPVADLTIRQRTDS